MGRATAASPAIIGLGGRGAALARALREGP